MGLEWACLTPETWLGPNLAMCSEYCSSTVHMEMPVSSVYNKKVDALKG